MESAVQSSVIEEGDGEQDPLLPRDHQHIDFRSGRETLQRSKCDNLVLVIFKICVCSLGLWGHQLWNYIPRVLVGALVVYQTVYDFYVVLGCPGFDCGFLQNSTNKNKTSHHKDDRKIANAVYTIVTVAAVISYFLFCFCFIATKGNTYVALTTPSESLNANNNDLDKKNVCCLRFAFTVITTLFLCSVAVFYAIIWSQPRNSFFDILATGVGAQFFAQLTAITTCHVFAVISFTLCKSYFKKASSPSFPPLPSPPLPSPSPLPSPARKFVIDQERIKRQLKCCTIIPQNRIISCGPVSQFVHCLPGVSKLIYRSNTELIMQSKFIWTSVPAHTYGGPIQLLIQDCCAQVSG